MRLLSRRRTSQPDPLPAEPAGPREAWDEPRIWVLLDTGRDEPAAGDPPPAPDER